MHSATRLETGRVHHRGQALTEWIIVLGTIALVAVLVFAAFGAVLHRQSGLVATELAGGGTTREGTSATLPQSIIQLAGLSSLRGLFSQLPGVSNSDPGGDSGSVGYGSFTPIPSAGGSATGSSVQCNRNDGQAGVGATGLPSQSVGNPIHIVTGNKYQEEVDLSALPGPLGLRFARHYNSASQGPWGLGKGWRHSYQVQLRVAQDHVWIWQADGRQIRFDRNRTKADGSVSYPAQRAGDGELVYRRQQGYEWHWISGRVLHFGLDKRLVRMHEGHRELRFYYDADGRLVEVRDPHQRTLHLSYYANGRLAKVKGPDRNLIGYRYDTIGNLTHVIYPDNTFRRYYYEDERHPHHLTGVSVGTLKRQGDEIQVNDDTRWSTYGYDAQGRGVLTMRANGVDQITLSYGVNEVRVTDTVGRISTYVTELRDGVPLVTAVYGPGCSQCGEGDVAYTYTKRFQLAAITTRDGITVRNTYDNRGRLHQQHRVLPDGIEQWLVTYRYRNAADAPLGAPVRIERPSINPNRVYATEYNYSAYGQPESIIETGYAPTPGGEYTTLQRVTRYRYDRFGRLVVIDGPRDDVEDTFQLRYDADDNLQTITRPDGTVVRILARDGAGRPTRLQIGRQPPIDMRYTARGQLAEASQPITDGLVRMVHYAYNPLGLLTAVTGSDGTVWEFTYDDAGRRTRVSDGTTHLSQHTEYADDGVIVGRRLLGPQDQVLQNLRYVYDAQRRLSEVHDGGGKVLAGYGYLDDRVQRPNRLIGPSGRVTQLAYNPLGQLLSLTQPGHIVTEHHYDDRNELAGLTDARDNITRYVKDDFGHTLTIESPDTGTTRYKYDAAGNRVQKEDAQGQLTTYAYDAANRLIEKTTADGTTEFHYDQGRLTHVRDPASEERFAYDHDGRLIAHTRDIDGLSFTTEYSYHHTTGQLAQKILPDGQVLDYHYHPDTGALRAITRDDYIGKTTVIGELNTLDQTASTRRFIHGNGIATEYRYDQAGRLTEIDFSTGQALAYRYDEVGRIIGIDRDGVLEQYRYDPLGRLTGADTLTGTYRYRYDALGNRTEQAENGETTTYTHSAEGEGNRLLTVSGDASPPLTNRDIGGFKDEGEKTYTYNPAGSPTTIGRRTYEYNAEQRPTRLYIDGKLRAEYAYNGWGERIKKVVYQNGKQPKVTYYFYDGHQLTVEANENGDIAAQYIYLKHQPVAKLEGRNIYALHTDHLGTPQAATNEDREIVWAAEYTPFGSANITTEQITLNLRFPGQYEDSEAGTYYNYFRDYDPETGRYQTSDPIGLKGGINTYAYVTNNPLALMDPLGLEGVIDGPIIGDTSSAGVPGKPIPDSFGGKLAKVFENAASQLPGEVGIQLKDLVNSKNLATTVTVLTLWGASQFTPAGPFVNLALGGLAYFTIGKSAVDLIVALGKVTVGIAQTKTDCDLIVLGDDVAKAVTAAGIGITTGLFLKSLPKVATKFPGKGSRPGTENTGGTALVPRGAVPLGQWGEIRLKQVLGGAGSKPKKAFKTSRGRRFIDRLANGVAHEAKAGVNVKLSSKIEKQILKDVELIGNRDIKGAHWHFFQGADSKLLDFLTQNGIKYTVHN